MAEQAAPADGASRDEPSTVPFFLDGEQVYAEKSFDVKSPASGQVIHQCGAATVQDALRAVESAAAAFRSWRKVPPGKRRDMLLQTAEVMKRRWDELAGYMMEETGAARSFADFNLSVAIDFIKDVAGRVGTIQGTVPSTADEDVSAMVLKEPYGVVLAIAAWNAPYILGTRSVLFPLAAGNTVVFKASETSPRTMWAIASCFHEAGLPGGVLNTIAHEPASAASVTSALIAAPEVKKINFTGSTAVGRIIARQAGEQLKPVLLELGGKAPAIVWEDADLDLAAAQCALGSFLHSGQICMSTERIIVHRKVRESFVEKLAGAVERFFPAGGEAAVLISPAAVDKNQRLLRDAVSKGASVVVGDGDGDGGAHEAGTTRMRPLVVGNVRAEMEIYRTESFGPTVSLLEVDGEEEALRLANDTEYGLTAAVFTEDLRRGLRMAREIESGAVHVNGMTVHDESCLPHGGAKASGHGRFNAAGLEEWVRTKSVTYRN